MGCPGGPLLRSWNESRFVGLNRSALEVVSSGERGSSRAEENSPLPPNFQPVTNGTSTSSMDATLRGRCPPNNALPEMQPRAGHARREWTGDLLASARRTFAVAWLAD